MKSINLLSVILFIALFVASCKKDTQTSTPNPDPLVEKAKEYFTSSVLNSQLAASDNPRTTTPKNVNWDRANIINLSVGRAVLIPIQYNKDLFIRTTQGGLNSFHLNNLAHLLLYQSKDDWKAEVITQLPDTNYLKNPAGKFSGMVYVEDWSGNAIGKYLYEGGTIRKYAPAPSSPIQALNVITIEICYQLTGYNYSTASPEGGYAWAETPVCIPSMVPVDDDPIAIDYGSVGGSAGGTGTATSSTGITITGGTSPISNMPNYLQCFTNSGGNDHTYTVTVFVDQPEPGTRQPWVITSGGPGGSYYAGNPVNVGHTFLAFTEQYGGTTITRNIGFYPNGLVKPGLTSKVSMLNNDQSHEYNISATFQVTNGAFFNMLSYISDATDPGFLYNLNSENCTTFALQTLYQGGINLPRTIGTWAGGGMGNDPGDLGEDLRNMPLLPNMTRSTIQSYHFNIGVCN